MDFKQIQELVRLVNKSSISELSIEQDAFKITIKRDHPGEGAANGESYRQAVPVVSVPASVPVTSAPPQEPASSAAAPAPQNAPKENLLTIKSPMIGTFYRSAGPDKPAFANVGDDVSAGKVVCIIDAMKLFNEIESEVSGKIVKVLVEDASPVEFDQPLFLVEP